MPSFADCSYAHFRRAAKSLGFKIYEGKKHAKVKSDNGTFVTMIPRKNRFKKWTAKGIAGDLVSHSSNKKKAAKIVAC